MMDADPRCCVVVEDSPSGVAAARAAGMRCLAFAGGVNPAGKLEGHSTVVFHRMDELPGLLARLPERNDDERQTIVVFDEPGPSAP